MRWPLLLMCAGAVYGQQHKTIRIPKVTRAPKIEDFLANTPREAETEVTDFRQNHPGDGTPPTEETKAYLSYDAQSLYVVFVCKAPQGAVRARYTRREDSYPDDEVGFALDTWHDRQHAFIFFSNARGIQSDALFTEGQGDESSFDTLWHSEGRLTDEGFVVWMAIPFRSLRFANTSKQTWGIALTRRMHRKPEYDWWPYIDPKVAGLVNQLGTLEGLEDISPGRNVQFIPYLYGARSHFLAPPGYANPVKGRAGLDGKAVFKDAFTFDYTLNPDFSQVESDEPQVTINQRFEVFFPERRPFFLENSGYFQTPLNLFFSRRIVDPEFGARLTGKLGRWALGALATDDRAAEQRATIGALRLRREIRKDSSVGLFFTSRKSGLDTNQVGSFDARFKFGKNWVYNGQAATCAQRGKCGTAIYSDLTRAGRKFFTTTTYEDITARFHTDLGYIPRTDIRRVSNNTQYLFRPEKSKVNYWGPYLNSMMNWDHQGRIEDWKANAGVAIEFKGNSFFNAERSESYEYYLGHAFRKEAMGGYFRTDYWRKAGFHAGFGRSTGINYSPARGLRPFLGEVSEVSAAVTLRPTDHLRVENSYLYTRQATQSEHTVVFTNHILRTKAYYQFTRSFSLRGIFDYNSVLPNRSLASDEYFKRFNADVLFTYLPHPGTAIYLGYSDRNENLDRLGMRRPGGPDLNTGRQVFVKLSYLIRR